MADIITLTFGGGDPADPPDHSEVPRQLGHVRLVEEVGQGAMGVVWRGQDEFLQRRVAVKLLRHRAVGDAFSRNQFVEGARAAAAIQHPNVVSIFHADKIGDLVYIVMEYVDGTTLQDVLRVRGALRAPLAGLVVARSLDALSAIHEAKVIHRDLKPSNVLFDVDGELKVSDFGLSFQQRVDLDADNSMGGTPAYMAPEMFSGESSYQSDVYAMGIMFFELLSGRRPFSADSVEGLHLKHRDEAFPLEILRQHGIDDAVLEVVERSVHKKKIFRYKSAAHMLQAVNKLWAANLLRDAGLARQLREVILDAPVEPRPHAAAQPQPPAATYFDLLTQRADAKRQRKGHE